MSVLLVLVFVLQLYLIISIILTSNVIEEIFYSTGKLQGTAEEIKFYRKRIFLFYWINYGVMKKNFFDFTLRFLSLPHFTHIGLYSKVNTYPLKRKQQEEKSVRYWVNPKKWYRVANRWSFGTNSPKKILSHTPITIHWPSVHRT